MTFVIYAMLILWIPACLAAAWFIIRPARNWPPFATRLRSVLMLLAFAFGIPIFVGIAAPDSMRVKPGEENKPKPVAAAPTPSPAAASPAASPPPAPAETFHADDAVQHPTRYLELGHVDALKGDNRTVVLSGKIFNGAALAIRNPKLKCYLSEDTQDAGTVSGTVRQTIPAGEEIAFKGLNMGAAQGAWNHQVCEITGAEAIEKK